RRGMGPSRASSWCLPLCSKRTPVPVDQPRLAGTSCGLHVGMSGEPHGEEIEQLLAGLEAALLSGAHPLDLTCHRLRLPVPLRETDHEIVEAIGVAGAGRGDVHGRPAFL